MRRLAETVMVCMLTAGGCFSLLHALSSPGEAPKIQTYVLSTQPGLTTTTAIVTTEPARTTATACTQMETTAHVLNTDLNTAQADDLCTVEGIGETLAQRILDVRTRLGGFTYREQLLEIRGIGNGLLERIMELFVIPGEQKSPQSLPPETTLPDPEPEVTTVTTMQERPFLEMNQMTLEQLRTVPGMTEQAAADILDMRTKIQYYSRPYELFLIESLDHDWIVSVLDCFYVTGVNDGVVSDHRD